MNLVLVGRADPALTGLLQDAGHQPKTLPLERLTDLASAGAYAAGIVLVDLRGQEGLPPGVAALKRRHPATEIVLVASQLDPAMMLEAMRIGVSEFLSEPLKQGEVEAALARIAAKRVAAEAAQVFAFVGAKGGVGTTTLAINIATTLGMTSPGNSLLVDLHLMGGDAAVYLGVEPKFSVVDALENPDRLDETFFRSLVVRSRSGLDVLASADRLVGLQFDASRIRSLIEFVARHYRYVILDVPRLDPMIFDVLESANAIVTVTSQEVASIRNAAHLSHALGQRYGRDKVKVVVGRANRLAEIGREDMERALGTGVRHEIPSDYRLALQAVNTGRPLTLDNHNELSGSIQALARELAGLANEKNGNERRSGLFGRLAGRRS